MWASLVAADLQLRVFGPSGFLHRPSDRLYLRTFVCLDAWIDAPVIPPFILKHDCPFGRTPVGVRVL